MGAGGSLSCGENHCLSGGIISYLVNRSNICKKQALPYAESELPQVRPTTIPSRRLIYISKANSAGSGVTTARLSAL